MFQGSKISFSTNTFKVFRSQGKFDGIKPFLKLLPCDCKQKTFNKYYLNSAQCKIFRKTYVSNNSRNFSRISKPAASYVGWFFSFFSCPAMNQ